MHALDRVVAHNPQALADAVAAGRPWRPLAVKLKLTSACNLRCSFCSQWRVAGSPPPKPDRLTFAAVEGILDDVAALGGVKLHLSGGEPLARPDLEDIVAGAARRGLRVSMTSNGTLWTRARARDLAKAGLRSVTFSLDALTPEAYAAQRGRDLFARMIEGVRAAGAGAADAGKRLKLKSNTVVTRLNAWSLGELPRVAASLGIGSIRLLALDVWGAPAADGLSLTAAEIRRFNREVAPRLAADAHARALVARPEDVYPFGCTDADAAYAARGQHARGFYERGRCYVPWTHAVVGPDGMVYPCCTLKGEKVAMGNAVTEGFRAVWEGEAYGRLRRDLAVAPHAACHRCDEYLTQNRYLQELLGQAIP